MDPEPWKIDHAASSLGRGAAPLAPWPDILCDPEHRIAAPGSSDADHLSDLALAVQWPLGEMAPEQVDKALERAHAYFDDPSRVPCLWRLREMHAKLARDHAGDGVTDVEIAEALLAGPYWLASLVGNESREEARAMLSMSGPSSDPARQKTLVRLFKP